MKYIVFFSIFLASTLSAQLSRFSDRDLYELGKVWGLTKYYHPAVSQGKLDWDAVLLQSLKDKAKSDADEMMNQWLITADQSKFDEIEKKR
ncbi:hypothetical protein [Chryseobacterium gregarium]|uniref:hypothetical protein n=1 Tax=Chryseobacterium gregarium TaxID=456299 RepID=UPI0004032F45|nr:hypothetical protein [Chryseobacterium gregarium]